MITVRCSARFVLFSPLVLLQVLQHLGLGEIWNSRIGGGLTRGVSGGEKRRLSIATEILTRPALLFLDEPTTGLGKAMPGKCCGLSCAHGVDCENSSNNYRSVL